MTTIKPFYMELKDRLFNEDRKELPTAQEIREAARKITEEYNKVFEQLERNKKYKDNYSLKDIFPTLNTEKKK